MSRKRGIYWGMFIGSAIGGYVPTWFGAGWLSFGSIITGMIGGIIGIYLVYKFTR
jgi:uncharacterized membrane protein YeaQ/YmgE (transglycosylase-associated protein family)